MHALEIIVAKNAKANERELAHLWLDSAGEDSRVRVRAVAPSVANETEWWRVIREEA